MHINLININTNHLPIKEKAAPASITSQKHNFVDLLNQQVKVTTSTSSVNNKAGLPLIKSNKLTTQITKAEEASANKLANQHLQDIIYKQLLIPILTKHCVDKNYAVYLRQVLIRNLGERLKLQE